MSKFLMLALSSAAVTFAGPIVTVTDAMSLAQMLVGVGVTLSGTPTLTGVNGQAGTFAGGGTNLIGFSSGIILSSGNVSSASGNYAGANSPSASLGGAGSALLSGLIGGATTNDAVTLTFSFIPTASTVFFQYTFASAEYPNFVGSSFNDVFGFFVNGTNFAKIPGTNTAVSINNVNATTNAAFFNKYNAAGDTLPYGGQTKVLTFTAPVNPNVVNTFTLAIADTSDSILDSAVFIQAGSVSTVPIGNSPEPASIGLMSAGLLGLGCLSRLRRKKA